MSANRSGTKTEKGHKGQLRQAKNPRECRHMTLLKVEDSGINDVDTDVSVYRCSQCRKPFTITED